MSLLTNRGLVIAALFASSLSAKSFAADSKDGYRLVWSCEATGTYRTQKVPPTELPKKYRFSVRPFFDEDGVLQLDKSRVAYFAWKPLTLKSVTGYEDVPTSFYFNEWGCQETSYLQIIFSPEQTSELLHKLGANGVPIPKEPMTVGWYPYYGQLYGNYRLGCANTGRMKKTLRDWGWRAPDTYEDKRAILTETFDGLRYDITFICSGGEPVEPISH